jgi:mono/diheme cytochrome c family protein
MRRERRRRGRGTAVGLLVLGLILGSGSGCSRIRSATVAGGEDGHAMFLRACASCHGVDGRGGGAVATTLAVPPPDLTTIAARGDGTFPRAHVIAVIAGEREIGAHGTREMPVWSQRFGPGGGPATAALHARRRLEMLATYLESLQRPATAP